MVGLSIAIFFFNSKLYYQPKYIGNANHAVNQDVIEQLYFLKHEIHAGEADKMQELFPEGFIFYNVIYGLTWCEMVAKLNREDILYKEAISEIDWTIKEVNSVKGREPFEGNLPFRYGAFYNGWTNLLLGQKLQFQSEKERKNTDIEQFDVNCEQIVEAYLGNNNSYLETYNNEIWQADNIICIASLALHDRIFGDKYQELISQLILKIKDDLDPKTGLIRHSKHEPSPRGSSQSLMNIFLKDIDSTFAKEQYERYKKNFFEKRSGLVFIREYPKGVAGESDVDSGPVIWDIGGVASIVAIKAMAVNKDFALAKNLRNNIEGLGFPVKIKGEKKYFLGQFSMADAFIAWSNVTEIDEKNVGFSVEKLYFHSISIIFIFLLLLLTYRLWKF